MKIYIIDSGERSVGIFPATITIDTPFCAEDFDTLIREDIRETLVDTFIELFQLVGNVNIYFEDEYPDCLKPLKNKKCLNKNCINNIERDIDEKE